jgi:hypothetical protein
MLSEPALFIFGKRMTIEEITPPILDATASKFAHLIS